jgi:hypothetical protein
LLFLTFASPRPLMFLLSFSITDSVSAHSRTCSQLRTYSLACSLTGTHCIPSSADIYLDSL